MTPAPTREEEKRQCSNDAAVRYIWPGKDEAFCCMEHALGIKRIAEAMGCPVHMHQITPDFTKEGWPKCSSFVKSNPTDAAEKERV